MNKKITRVENIIIGAGPAGLQLAYFFEKDHRDYLVLEKNSIAGSFFQEQPRHKKLLSINKVYTGYTNKEKNMRWDWNSLLSDSDKLLFKNYTKDYFPSSETLVKYLNDYAKEFDLKIQYNTDIVEIDKYEEFIIKDSQNNYFICNNLIIATGTSIPHIPKIKGIEYAVQYTQMDIDPEHYIGKRVLILGKGNSAFETADSLVGTTALIHIASPNSLKLAWQTHFPGHLRAINNNFVDTYLLKSQNGILDANIEEIVKESDRYKVTFKYCHANNEIEEIYYDSILCCTGFKFDTTIFAEHCKPNLTDCMKLPLLKDNWECKNIENMYFIGTLMQMRDFKKTTSSFIHGFRYNIRAFYNILRKRFFNEELEHKKGELSLEKLCESVLSTINETSGLWQQFGFLADVITLNSEDPSFKHYKELPLDYIFNSKFVFEQHFLTITLEYGSHMIDPFNYNRISKDDHENAQKSEFLHPVIRSYSGSQMVSEFHLLEDLESDWSDLCHTQPLKIYLAKVLTKPAIKMIANFTL